MPAQERTLMRINELQRVLLDTYADGEFAHLKRSEDLRECGDGLLKFLFYELDEDCSLEAEDRALDAVAVATQRLLTAVAQINHVSARIIARMPA
jgi:hypothetical protein